jgi:hypothetical protein
MVVNVKKNKTPKASKHKGKSMLQKQTVSQNVKVNIYKDKKVPRDFKIKQLSRDGAGGTPNIRALPQSVFHSTVVQPSPTLYKEQFGYAKPVNVSPFERLLASEAVDNSRQLETATLRNALESSRLKAIQRQPIEAPVRRGESEEDRFLERARASQEEYKVPFRISTRQEAGTLGVSFRDRLSQAEYLREARKAHFGIPNDASLRPPNTVQSSLEQALQEGLTGERDLSQGESQTFRTDALGGDFSEQFNQGSVQSSPQGGTDHEHTQILGEPSIPDRLVSYLAQEGTSGDILEDQRGEVVPVTQGEIQEGQISSEAPDYTAQLRYAKVQRFLKKQAEKKAQKAIQTLHQQAVEGKPARQVYKEYLAEREALANQRTTPKIIIKGQPKAFAGLVSRFNKARGAEGGAEEPQEKTIALVPGQTQRTLTNFFGTNAHAV